MLRTSLLIFFAILVGIIDVLVAHPAPLPLVRYSNVNNGDHFYTLGGTEIGFEAKYGYNCEGAIGWAYPSQVPNSVPLYRYWNGADHFYTTNAGEIGTVTPGQRGRGNYVSEGITGYVFAGQVPNSIPLYRYCNGRDHFYTTNAGEIGTITPGQRGKYNYVFEGIQCYILPVNIQRPPVTDQGLWNKYRDHLIENLSKVFCGGAVSCGQMAGTGFQMTTTPVVANWHNDPYDLSQNMCYTPKYSPIWDFQSVSKDGMVSDMFKKFLFTIPPAEGKSPAMKLMAFESSYQQQCLPWEEVGVKLNDWKNWVTSNFGPEAVTFQFHFDVDFETAQRNSWTNFGSYNGNDYFLRANKPATSSDREAIISKNMPFSDSNGVIHKFQDGVQLISTNRFDMTFSARAIGIFTVQPSSSWFDANIALKYRDQLRSKGLAFVPKNLIIAMNPRVTITVSKSIYESIQQKLNSAFTSWNVGGVKFRNPTLVSSDSEIPENRKGDFVIMRGPKHEKQTKYTKDMEVAKALSDGLYNSEEPESDSMMNLSKFFDETITGANSENSDSDSAWFWRRRRNDPPRVETHVNLIPQVEGDYTIEFVSQPDSMEVLGVVSTIV